MLLFCDEAQRYNENEYEWLRDVHDVLDRQQIKLFTFLVGQEELLAQKTALQIAGKTQIVARLMVDELAFSGIRNAQDVATCLNGYDQMAYPEGTPWSFTRFYVPQAFDAGYRLVSDAGLLWQTFEAAHHKASLPGGLEIPMESFARAVEIVLRKARSRMHRVTAPKQSCGPTRFIIPAIPSPAMPPDVCSQPPSCEVLKALRFPILTFDEWQTGRALGSDFNTDWLMPGESLVSILWKFACAHALPGDALIRRMCPDVDPLDGVIPERSLFDLAQLRRLLRLPMDVLRISLLNMPRERYQAAFRYCRQCAAHGYHRVLHQLAEENRCAAHQQRLRTQCPQCRRESAFIISSSVIEAPFRCVWCRSYFAYGLLPLRSTTPAMRRQDRLAIQRRVILRLGSEPGP